MGRTFDDEDLARLSDAMSASKIIAVTELASQVARDSFKMVADVARLALGEAEPSSKRRLPEGLIMVGFARTTIPPREVVYVHAHPQICFKLRYLHVAPELAKKVSITDVRVGRNSMLVSAEHISASVFANLGVLPLACDVAQPGTVISIGVLNESMNEPISFEATGFGEGLI